MTAPLDAEAVVTHASVTNRKLFKGYPPLKLSPAGVSIGCITCMSSAGFPVSSQPGNRLLMTHLVNEGHTDSFKQDSDVHCDWSKPDHSH